MGVTSIQERAESWEQRRALQEGWGPVSSEVKSQVRAVLEPGGRSWPLEKRKSERGLVECSNSVQKFGMNNNITCSVALNPPNNP